MKNCGPTSRTSPLEHVEWKVTADASAPILRKAAEAAVLQDSRLTIRFDRERGEWELGITAGR
ncbi:MAG: hypothetical protein GX632_09265 [Propioniciclava sp.]|nr:hypothetical protein [Propioniciclava sp.]